MARLTLVVIALCALPCVPACDPVDACDADQYFQYGSCHICPDDATKTGDRCTCNDPDKVLDDDECVYRAGTEPDDADAGDQDDAGSEPLGDASTSGAGAAACSEYCAFLQSCVAENGFAAGLVADVIAALGLEDGTTSACEEACVADADEAANLAALECFQDAAATAACAGDQTFTGADEALSIADQCCAAHAASGVCERLCAAIGVNPISRSLVPSCQ